ncbi:MAG TPA: SigB/SigF/SigG family RNA polymerase sigma factor [Solirubrobacteraceae bacterium]|nr:SigB/SigF/SigG family RNA polymerase sigma factor [Solirubrobacteraceae bacterium]
MTDTLNLPAPTSRGPWRPAPVAAAGDLAERSWLRSANEQRRTGAVNDRRARAVEEQRLFARYRRRDDPAARAALVERFLPLAKMLARRYNGGAEPLDDLVQVASLGLLKAIDRFDPDRGTAFSTFAVPTILGELKRHFRDKGWSVRVPRDLQELTLRVERASDLLEHELRRAPTPSEIADRLAISVEQVLDAYQAAGAHRADSLDRTSSDDDQDDRHLADSLGSEDPGYRQAEDAATLGRLMSVLDNRERELLRLRFAEDLTQSEIGHRLGLSQMHVSRLLRHVVAQLREAAESGRPPTSQRP